jgi:NAD(P)H-hydrate epimerase
MTAGFITVKGLGDRVKGIVDCTLIGPGMGKSRRTYNLTRRILASNTKAVLDADALNVLDAKLRKLLSERHILTPHKMEFYRVFKLAPTAANVLKMAGKYRCTIVLKGPVDVIGHPKKGIVYNRTGNQGMTKGGTGDVLAGLIAALSCKNDAYPAAAAGVFINGRAGDDLYKKVGTFYSAEDLVEQIPKTMWYLLHPAP